MKTISVFMLIYAVMVIPSQQEKHVEAEGIRASYCFRNNTMHFELSAPTTGWVALGLNSTDQLQGSSLIMCRVQDGQVEIVDHFVRAPGDYLPVTDLGQSSLVQEISGTEIEGKSSFAFTLPLKPESPYHHTIVIGSEFTMHLAYSVSDDFQHHSIKRTKRHVVW
jgi:hypothetical protein